MFSMHVACDMHTTLYPQYCDMHVSLNMHGSCMQHAHYMQEISTRGRYKLYVCASSYYHLLPYKIIVKIYVSRKVVLHGEWCCMVKWCDG